MRVEDFLSRLEAVRGDAPQWAARCPAHDDRQASLTVGLGKDGRILVTCWAGCTLEDICRAAGVTVADLFDQEAKRNETLGLGAQMLRALSPPLPTEEEVTRDEVALLERPDMYQAIERLKGWNMSTLAAAEIGVRGNRLTIPIRNLKGELVQYLKYWPELQPKMLATRGHKRTPLYLLHDDGPLWIVEGETDAISAACCGFAVIGAPGASAKAHAEWLEPVRGRDVIVCMDHDEPGRKAAARWALTATNKGAASVTVIELHGHVEGYDVTDVLLEAGNPQAARWQLLELARTAEPFQPVRTTPKPTAAPDVDTYETGDIILTPLSSFRVRRLRMLWRDRIPIGRLGIIYGPPGQGKSTLLALLIADVTRLGGRVLIASAEEAPETTLLPRAIAAGADVGLVDLISTKATDGSVELVLPRDLKQLERRMSGSAMLLIDPLVPHIGDEINAWHEQQIRAQILAPLGQYADRTGCAVPVVMHMNKSNHTDPLSRISGSGGFGAAARWAMLLGSHPDDIGLPEDDRRVVLVHVKANETRRQLAMVFRRKQTAVDGGNGEIAVVPMLELEDDAAMISPEAVLEHTDPDEAGAFTQAIEFLKYELSDGPKPSKRMTAAARERGDFSERTLRKAKHALGAPSFREANVWYWKLPA